MRANIGVGGVPAFREDRFVGTDASGFVVGAGDDAIRFEGDEPCARCVASSRDPEGGDQLPELADGDAFEHLYALGLISRVPRKAAGGRYGADGRGG